MKITESMIANLARQYPGKKIVRIPERNPQEVICEVERSFDGSYGVAVAIIAQSMPHFHVETWEVYKVLKGRLILYGRPYALGRRQFLGPHEGLNRNGFRVISPNTVHWAQAIGRPSTVLVVSSPAWSSKDHHIPEDAKKLLKKYSR